MQEGEFPSAYGLAVRRVLERCRMQEELLADVYDALLSMELKGETFARETSEPRRCVAEAVAVSA